MFSMSMSVSPGASGKEMLQAHGLKPVGFSTSRRGSEKKGPGGVAAARPGGNVPGVAEGCGARVRSGRVAGALRSRPQAPFAPRGLGRGSGAKGARQVDSRRRSVAGRGVPAVAVLRPMLREVRRRCSWWGAIATDTIIGRAARPLEKPRYHSPAPGAGGVSALLGQLTSAILPAFVAPRGHGGLSCRAPPFRRRRFAGQCGP